MIFPSLRRLLKSRILRASILILVVWTFLEAFYIHRILLNADTTPVSRVNTEKIFIASLPWNNEIIFRTHMINQIRDLVHVLGTQNIYISIYENGSYDGTKDALRDLHRELEELGVRSRVILDETSHEDIVKARPTTPTEGWIKMEKSGFEEFQINRGDYALRRIHYLAQLRNRVLQPLWQLAEKGEKFDKIIFLNDVVFSSDDILNLLQTRNGQYATACTLDFETSPAVYDTFALRDSEGHLPLMQTWPFFRSAASREAVIANQPVPVQSCWNGKSDRVLLFVVLVLTIRFSQRRHRSHVSNPLLQPHQPPPLPRRPRQSSPQPHRRLRMLPHPRRQPTLPRPRRLDQPQRPRGLLPLRPAQAENQIRMGRLQTRLPNRL